MKNLFLTLLLTFSFSVANAQERIITTEEYNRLENKVDLIISNNFNHHSQYNYGRWFSLAGQVTTIIGGIAVAPEVVLIGSAAVFVGFIIEWDSHKWFGGKFMSIKNQKKISVKRKEITSDNQNYKIRKNEKEKYDSLSFLKDSYVVISTEKGLFYVKIVKSKKKYIKVEDFLTSNIAQFWYSEINDARIMTDIDINRLTNE